MKTRVIVIGFGFMGQTHVGSLLNMPDAELAGIVDPVDPKERLTTITGNCATERVSPEEIGAIRHFRSLEEALQASYSDAAIIALPTKLHYDAVIQCLKAGLHVMVEKPFAISLMECDHMVRTAEETDKLLAVGYVVRRMKEYQFLKQTIESGRLGNLKYLKMTRITGIPNWGNWNDPEFIRTSGGSLFDLVSHDIDFARFCLGEPEKIEVIKNLGGGQFKMISSIMRFRETDAVIEGGFVTPAGHPFSRTYAAYFENGTLVSSTPGKVTEYRNDKTVEHDFLPDNPYFTEAEDFIRAIRTGDASRICTGRDARETIECCTRIAEAIGYPLPEMKERNLL
jgi:predicted dehydrogenase